jgi:hypothetical protein
VLILIVLLICGGVGFGVWKVTRSKKTTPTTTTISPTSTQTTPSPSPTSPPLQTTAPPADPLSGWQSYTDSYGKYTIKYPTTWVRQTDNASLCSQGLVLLASANSVLGKCASDAVGEVMVFAVKNVSVDSEKLTKKYYPDLKEVPITSNGITGVKQFGTYKTPVGETNQGIGPVDGEVTEKYVFQKNSVVYVLSYVQIKGHETDLETFDTIATKGFSF